MMSLQQLRASTPLRLAAMALITCSTVLLVWFVFQNKPHQRFVVLLNFALTNSVLSLFVPFNMTAKKDNDQL
jgi:hypothetical protein